MPPPLTEAEVATLFRRYAPALARRCLALVGNPADAQELVQEVFYQFFRDRHRFEGRSSVFTFLYRIATNLSIDKLRRRRTAGEQLELDEGRRHATQGNPHVHAAALEELAVLTVGLDEEVLTVAVMAHVDGLTQDEIADALDLSRRTVGKKLKRFLLHTRAQAAQHGLATPALKLDEGDDGQAA